MNSETPPAMEGSEDSFDNYDVMDMDSAGVENDPASFSIQQVLQNDMLLDMIVNSAITSESVTSPNSSESQLIGVRSLRLVNRSWLQSVSRVMTKKKMPLFSFCVHQRYGFVVKSSLENGRKSDVHWFLNDDDDTLSLPIHQPVPPFKMEIDFDNFTGEEDVNHLLPQCLLKYGAALVDLTIDAEITGLPVLINQELLESFSFPNLKTLRISDYIEDPNPNMIESLFLFVHSILRAAESLSTFEISANFKIEVSPNSSISFNLPFIPASLQQFTVELAKMGNAELVALIGNRLLPNLTRLKLIDTDMTKLEDGTLYMILNNLRDNLKILEIGINEDMRGYQDPDDRIRSILRFPVMKKLEKLKICTELIELEPGQAPLENFIPNVSHLELTHQTEEMLQRWTEESEYPAVETLVVNTVIDDGSEDEDYDYICQGINVEVAEWITTSFLNVTKLTVLVLPKETSGLKTIFEMAQLTSLHIQVRGTNRGDTDPLFMDSALIDWPEDIVSTFMEDPELCDGVQIKRGIGKLKNLQSFHLEHMRDDNPASSGYSLSLDLTFKCAFRHLRKLETVRLRHGCNSSWHVSPEVRRKLNGKI